MKKQDQRKAYRKGLGNNARSEAEASASWKKNTGINPPKGSRHTESGEKSREVADKAAEKLLWRAGVKNIGKKRRLIKK